MRGRYKKREDNSKRRNKLRSKSKNKKKLKNFTYHYEGHFKRVCSIRNNQNYEKSKRDASIVTEELDNQEVLAISIKLS